MIDNFIELVVIGIIVIVAVLLAVLVVITLRERAQKKEDNKQVKVEDELEERKAQKSIFKFMEFDTVEDNMIVQDYLPGDDTYMRVLTSYSDKHGKVKMMCLGHVLLEEHTPYGIGNHAVIITEYEPELMEKFKTLLEEIGYKGFSNFDIKYDCRDKKYKAFEFVKYCGLLCLFVVTIMFLAQSSYNPFIYFRF